MCPDTSPGLVIKASSIPVHLRSKPIDCKSCTASQPTWTSAAFCRELDTFAQVKLLFRLLLEPSFPPELLKFTSQSPFASCRLTESMEPSVLGDYQNTTSAHIKRQSQTDPGWCSSPIPRPAGKPGRRTKGRLRLLLGFSFLGPLLVVLNSYPECALAHPLE